MYKKNLHIKNGAGGRLHIHPIVALLLLLLIMLSSDLLSVPLAGFVDHLTSSWHTPLGTIAALTLKYLMVPFATPLVLLFFWVTFAERRNFTRLGFSGQNPLPTYLKGFALGTAFMSLYCLIALGFGTFSFETIRLNIEGSNLFLSGLMVLLGWLLQGASEEILTRGWLLQVCAQKRVATGMILSSGIFALLHLGNPGMGLLPLLNLILYGLFAACYTLYTENLWGVCAFHSAWNWAQGNLYGIAVSGNETIGPSILIMGAPQGSTILTGGSFGAEGSLVITVLLSLGIACILYLTHRKEKSDSV